MLRIFRFSLCLLLLAGLVACGNKGDLLKPSAPSAPAPANALQG